MRIEGMVNAVNYSQQVQTTSEQHQNTDQQLNAVQKSNDTQRALEDKSREGIAATEIVQQIFATQKGEQSISEKAFKEVIDKANKALIGAKTEFRYSVHEKTNEIMVKVVDHETGDIIREIPPEKILDLVAKLQELAGVFVDEKR